MKLGINGRFYGAPVTGVQRFAREVGDRLSARTDTVLFLPRGVLMPAGATYTRTVHGRLTGHLWEQLELPVLARRHACRVVLHMSGTAPVLGGPAVLLVHDVFPFTNPEWYTRAFAAWYRLTVARAARRAATVITVSAWSARQIADVLAVPSGRIHVVPQGTGPFDAAAPSAEVARVRAKFGLPERFLLAGGAGDARKNGSFLLEVLECWRARHGAAPPLVVVGAAAGHVYRRAHTSHSAGTPDATPAAQALPGGVQGGVYRLGRVDDRDLHALYTGARAFCFPSIAEGFGRPPLEALACGTPVVVAPYGPAREVLGGAARIVALDPEAWVDALVPLCDDDAEHARSSAEGIRQAARFQWDAAAAEVLALCMAAAAEPHATPGNAEA